MKSADIKVVQSRVLLCACIEFQIGKDEMLSINVYASVD